MSDFEPQLVASDGQGNVFEIEGYSALGAAGNRIVDVPQDQWIPLPEGSDLMELPGRLPVGRKRETGAIDVIEGEEDETLMAVAAFLAPAYTVLYNAAWEREDESPYLSLFAYSAVGWHEGRFYVPALRIDPDIRQDPGQFSDERLREAARQFAQRYPDNRLARHLIQNCALTYGCPAARNYLLNRWEMPLPTSRVCNASCIGCISLQEDSGVCATQNRIAFVPTVEEIVEIAVDHFETAPLPVASFGQGCEGEPLLNGKLLAEAIRGIRRKTNRGTINLNTNASLPDTVSALRQAGLDSMRVSLNSAREEYYQRYFRPAKYSFSDVLQSIRIMKDAGGFVSLNYFVFPGFSDQPEEIEQLEKLIEGYGIDLIQWRNLNIDPELYWQALTPPDHEGIGIARLIAHMQRKYPALRHGYFNPYLQ